MDLLLPIDYAPKIQWFEFLQGLLVHNDTKFEFGLLVLMLLWLIDWLTGMYKATKTHSVDSDVGKDGFIKHGIVILLLIIFIPISIVFGDVGITSLWIGFTGYMVNEVISILENLSQAGIDVSFLSNFIKNISKK